MKIKVRVADIIQALEAKDAAAKRQYEKALAQFHKDESTHEDRFIKAVAQLAADLKQGRRTVAQVSKAISNEYGRGSLQDLKLPTRPTAPRKPGTHEGRIKQLKLSSEPFLMLTTDELACFGIGTKECVC